MSCNSFEEPVSQIPATYECVHRSLNVRVVRLGDDYDVQMIQHHDREAQTKRGAMSVLGSLIGELGDAYKAVEASGL